MNYAVKWGWMKKREVVFQPEFIEDLRYWVKFFTTTSTTEHDGKSLSGSSGVSLRGGRGENISNHHYSR